MISRVRAGFAGGFFDIVFEGVNDAGRRCGGFTVRGLEVAGVDVGCSAGVVAADACPCLAREGCAMETLGGTAIVPSSGGSEDGGSEPMLGFRGVRNGDLNGLLSVFAASFSRRRLACGVDISGWT